MAKFPAPIQKALEKIPYLLGMDLVLHTRTNTVQKMHSQRIESLAAVLEVLVRTTCLGIKGAAGVCLRVLPGMNIGVPIVISTIAERTGFSTRTVDRCLHDLKDLGLLDSKKQLRKMGPDGLEVSASLRWLSKKFWSVLGLWEVFKKFCEGAAGKIKLSMPMKVVSNAMRSVVRAEKTFKRLTGQVDKPPSVWDRASPQARNKAFVEALQCLGKCGKGCQGGKQAATLCQFCKDKVQQLS